MIGIDSDCLIYAANEGNPLGEPVRGLVFSNPCIGSVMLLPELLIKPGRLGYDDERARLIQLLSHLDLVDVTSEISNGAVALGAKYGLRSIDAVHLSTAVYMNADRFVTNNKRDFPTSITEIDIVYPADL